MADATKQTLLSDAKELDNDLGDLDVAYDQDKRFLMEFYILNVSEAESMKRRNDGKRRHVANSRHAYLAALRNYCEFRSS